MAANAKVQNEADAEDSQLDAEAEREVAEFVRCGHLVVDTIAQYYRSLRRRPVAPTGRLYPLRDGRGVFAGASENSWPLQTPPADIGIDSNTHSSATAAHESSPTGRVRVGVVNGEAAEQQDERRRTSAAGESESESASCFEVKPGYVARLLPARAPASPEPFEHVLRDFEALVLPGVRYRPVPSLSFPCRSV